jgi:hypothetical protein
MKISASKNLERKGKANHKVWTQWDKVICLMKFGFTKKTYISIEESTKD